MARWRSRRLSIGLAVVAAVLTLASTVIGYVNDRVFDSDAFAGLTRDSLESPEIRNFLADEIADEILRVAPDAAVAGTAIRDLTATLLETDFAQGLVETSARDLHRTVFDDDADSMLLFVSDLAVTVRAQLALVDPDLAELIPEELNAVAVDMGTGDRFMRLAQVADDIDGLASIAAVGALLTIIATVLMDSNRWRGAGHAGLAVAMAGGLTLVALSVGGSVLASYTDDLRAGEAIDAAWSVFIGDLMPWAWTLIVVGSLVCALSWSLLRFGDLMTPVERLRSFAFSRPRTRTAQLTRAGIGIAVAVWLIRDSLSLVTFVSVVGGIALGIVSTREILRVTGVESFLGSRQPSGEDRPDLTPWSAAVLGGVAVLALGLVAAVATAVLVSNDPASADDDNVACNGHVLLCPRRLDQVAMAATHNSMSASVDGFLLANQTRGIVAQLDAGYRGLLIDTWYGLESVSGPVFTIDPDNEGMDEASEAAAQRVRERVGGELDDSAEVYLCHGFCELGSVDGVSALSEVRDWLLANPREVLVIFVQDMTTPEDTASIFKASGLAELAFVHERGTPLPTLDEMISSHRRVFVMAEEDPGDIDFFHDGFTYTQETPFSFSSAAAFSCEPNRGETDSPLFQVNHFITPALGRNGVINELDVLLPRLEQCREERGLLPNLVAVDFWEAGDTLTAIDVLNGTD